MNINYNKLRLTFKFLYSIIFIFSLIQFGCTKETNIIEQPKTRTLFLLSDNNAGSDLMIAITGNVRANYPDVDIKFVQAKAFDIKEAAYLLEQAASDYPAGTYFVGLVEPGASSDKMVFNTPEGSHFLVPDNGIATRVIKTFKPQNFYYSQNPAIYDGKNYQDISFNDYYVKTILAMLSGKSAADFGPAVTAPVTYPTQDPFIQNDTIYGEVLFTDDFGNCITNITDAYTQHLAQKDLLKITAGSRSFFASFGTTYSSVPVGENVAFVHNSNRVEISVDYGNISQRYSMAAGTLVSITKGKAKVGFLLYNESQVVKDIIAGAKSELAAKGLIDSVNVIYIQKSAGGDPSLLAGLINDLIVSNVDVIIPISTPAAQAAVEFVPESIPLIYTIITDPKSAGLIGKRLHVSGLSDATNYTDFVNFVTQLLPNLKTAGSIYNNNESNSVYAQSQLASILLYKNINYNQVTAGDVASIPNSYSSLKSKNIEAIFTVADNVESLGMSTLAPLAISDHIPVIGDAFQDAQIGALSTISVDYDAIASGTGDFILSVLRGVDPDNVATKTFPTNVIAVNLTTATNIGFTFPQDILNKAKYKFN